MVVKGGTGGTDMEAAGLLKYLLSDVHFSGAWDETSSLHHSDISGQDLRIIHQCLQACVVHFMSFLATSPQRSNIEDMRALFVSNVH